MAEVFGQALLRAACPRTGSALLVVARVKQRIHSSSLESNSASTRRCSSRTARTLVVARVEQRIYSSSLESNSASTAADPRSAPPPGASATAATAPLDCIAAASALDATPRASTQAAAGCPLAAGAACGAAEAAAAAASACFALPPRPRPVAAVPRPLLWGHRQLLTRSQTMQNQTG